MNHQFLQILRWEFIRTNWGTVKMIQGYPGHPIQAIALLHSRFWYRFQFEIFMVGGIIMMIFGYSRERKRFGRNTLKRLEFWNKWGYSWLAVAGVLYLLAVVGAVPVDLVPDRSQVDAVSQGVLAIHSAQGSASAGHLLLHVNTKINVIIL